MAVRDYAIRILKALDWLPDAPAPDPVTRVQTALDAVINTASGLGSSIDKSTQSRWAPVVPLSKAELENAFRGNWLARQAVSVPAADSMREWVDHHASAPKDFVERVRAAETRLKVRSEVLKAGKWARLYGGAILLLGVSDGKDPNELLEPFDVANTKKGQLRYVRAIDRWMATGDGQIDFDIASGNFDHPEFYSISGATSGLRAHHTRVIRFDGDALPPTLWWQNARWNDSILQAADGPIKDVTAAFQAVVSMLHEANFDVVNSPMMTELLADTGDAGAANSALMKRFSAMAYLKSWMRIIVLGQDEKYETKSHSFAEIANILEKLQITATGAVDIPFTRLYGQSPAGLTATGESDLQNYYNKISSDQETELRPRLATLFECLIRSELGAYPDGYTFTFKPLWKEPSSTKATTEGAIAVRDSTYLQAGVVTPPIVAQNLRDAGVYQIDDAHMAKLQDLEDNPPDPFGEEPPPAGAPPSVATEGEAKTGEASKGEVTTQGEEPAVKAKVKGADFLDELPIVFDGWEDQDRNELGQWGAGAGTASTGLKEGKHVESLKMRANTRASLREAVRSTVRTAGLHAALAKHPLKEIAVVKSTQVWKQGVLQDSKSSGVYDRNTNSIQVKGTRPEGSWGKEYTPGEVHAMSQCAPTHDEAIARTLLHEIGHHLFHQDESLKAAAQAAYDAHPRDSTGRFDPRGFSKYAEKSASEYMSEALVAYTYHREALAKYAPQAHALAAKFVETRGLKQ